MYMPLFLQVDSSLNFLTQSIQIYTNVAIAIKDFIGSSRVNYKKALYSLCKCKKCLIATFMKMNGSWILVLLPFDLKKGTTKVAVSKLWLVYCVLSMQICLFSTGQIFQFGLRVKSNKSSSTFHNKSGDAVSSATLNLWGNIQIVKTYIIKHNISNPVSLVIRHLDFETLHYQFEHASDKVMHYVLDNVGDVKKICFPTQKYVCHDCTFGKMY